MYFVSAWIVANIIRHKSTQVSGKASLHERLSARLVSRHDADIHFSRLGRHNTLAILINEANMSYGFVGDV